jgi:dihydroorotase-like cyclic amidohydrolase
VAEVKVTWSSGVDRSSAPTACGAPTWPWRGHRRRGARDDRRAGGSGRARCAGCLVGPGLVDLHTHLRQPGREEAETVESGARAAALGGYTAVVAMPNTEPAIDSAGVARDVLALGAAALAEVAVAGAITVGRAGKALAPLGRAGRARGAPSSPTTGPACRTVR